MRKKTDQKKQSILDAAYVLFRSHGFEKTSMNEINAQAGCSKRTLYNYFASKEDLFVECMSDLVENYLDEIFACLYDPNADLETALHSLGENALRLICSPEMVVSRRLIITEAERSGIGELFYERVNSWQQEISIFLAKAMDEGKLRRDDPFLATLHLRVLLEAELLEPCLLAVQKPPISEEKIRGAADRAVNAFLHTYAPTGTGLGRPS